MTSLHDGRTASERIRAARERFPNMEPKQVGDYVRHVHPCDQGTPDGLVLQSEAGADELGELGTLYVRVGSGSTVYGPVGVEGQLDLVEEVERVELERPARRTRRERLEARAERRREWAQARDRDGDAARDQVHAIGDRIPFGQPILIGHHSERGARADQRRMENGRRRAVENWNMADRHEQAAGGIERQLRTSIFSDDTDAVEQLEAKIGRLEEKRDRWKKYNRARRGLDVAAFEFLDEQQRRELDNLARFSHLRDNGQTPGYVLTNLTANIRRLRGRLEEIKKTATMQAVGDRGRGKPMLSRYAGECPDCGEPIEKGSPIVYYRVTREAVHATCETPASA